MTLMVRPFVLTTTILLGALLATPASAVPNAVDPPASVDGEFNVLQETINRVRFMVSDLPLPCIIFGGGNGMDMTCYVCVGGGGYGETPLGFYQPGHGTAGGYVAAGYSSHQGWGPYVGAGAGPGNAQC